MNTKELEKMYQELLKMDDTDDGIFDFEEALLSSDDDETLNFHFNILQDDNDEYLKAELFSFFTNRENINVVDDFLYRKYIENKGNDEIISEIIQLLGHLKGSHAKEVALENITIRKGDLRYRSIIVLGWVGNQKDLGALNDRLLNDPDGQLRGYAATAMRQIWFNHPKTKDEILHYLKNAISKEEDNKALEGIIITAQELLKKKLGLKESNYGDVTGDYQVAKIKTIDALKVY